MTPLAASTQPSVPEFIDGLISTVMSAMLSHGDRGGDTASAPDFHDEYGYDNHHFNVRNLQLQQQANDSGDDNGDSDDERSPLQIAIIILGGLFLLFLLYTQCINPLRYLFCRERHVTVIPYNTPQQNRLRQLRQRELQRRSNLLTHNLISNPTTHSEANGGLTLKEREEASEKYRSYLESRYETNQLRVELAANNIIQDADGHVHVSKSTSSNTLQTNKVVNDDDDDDNDIETGNSNTTTTTNVMRSQTISSPTTTQSIQFHAHDETKTAEGICAICLEKYEPKDVILSSQNCTHAFHEECMTDYLVLHHVDNLNAKRRDDPEYDAQLPLTSDELKSSPAPCPCCRRQYL